MKKLQVQKLLFACLTILLMGVFLANPSQAADKLSLESSFALKPVPVMLDPTPNYNHILGEKKLSELSNLEALSSTFTINYLPSGSDPYGVGDNCTVWPAAAQAAFSSAVNIWASKINSPVPIVIDACWATNLPTGVLGHAATIASYRNFTNAPQAYTWYQSALANALAGTRVGTNSADMYIAYSSGFDWYFGTDGNPPTTQIDFVTVIAHEIAHGLGFSGSMKVVSEQGEWGGGTAYPYIYDTFAVDGANQELTNTSVYPNPSAYLGTTLTGGGVYFNGANASAANGGNKVKLYAPSTWKPGSSYSHLDYDTYVSSNDNALMVFAISQGRAIHDQGPITMGLLKDLGWSISYTKPTVPGAPTNVTATAGSGMATVSFTAPPDGGSPITQYTVTSSPGSITATGTASPISVYGLTNGISYSFTVKATNAIGTGAASQASNSVIPGASFNGVCGSSNGATLTSPPTANLCSVGTPSPVTGSGPWSWTCTGPNGGSVATCSANIKTYSVTFSSNNLGTLSGATSQTVKHGGSATPVTAIPVSGYTFDKWTGTGGFTSTDNPLTLSNVVAAMNISANYKRVLTISSDQTYTNNKLVMLDIAPPNGKQMMRIGKTSIKFGKWMPVSNQLPWKLSSANGTQTVYIQFKSTSDPISGTYQTYSDSIVLDSKAPAAKLIIDGNEKTTYDHEVSLSLLITKEETSGVESICIKFTDVCSEDDFKHYNPAQLNLYKFTATFGDAFYGKATVYARVKDVAGNISKLLKAKITVK